MDTYSTKLVNEYHNTYNFENQLYITIIDRTCEQQDTQLALLKKILIYDTYSKTVLRNHFKI